METPLVSISVITYNHENYITQAIEGILKQHVNFSYEIIIGDDCSTDRTREILLNYQSKHPSLFRLLLHEKKGEGIPGKLNFMSTIEAATGKYIALLDGDDYWTDETKLQKQIDFLESHSEYSICFHKAAIVYEGGIAQFYPDVNENTKQTTTLLDLIRGNYIHASTCVFRRNFTHYPDWFLKIFTGDWVTHILNAEFGKIFYIDKEMAAYRIHNRGLISANNSLANNLNKMEMYKALSAYFQPSNEEAYKWFSELHYHQKAFYYGIENVGQLRASQRIRILLNAGLKVKKPKLLIAALLVPFFPENKLGKIWRNAGRLKNGHTE